MNRILLTSQNLAQAAADAAAVLRAGGVVLYPTDTIYGLGADALDDAAVEKVFLIKGRDDRKPIHAIVADMAMAELYAEFNDDARAMARAFWPGALTLVLKKKEGITNGIARDLPSIGLRIPDHPFCIALAREFGKPFTATSANLAGKSTEHTIESILAQLRHTDALGARRSVGAQIDLVIDAGELPPRQPSTVVRFPFESVPLKTRGGLGETETFAYGAPEVLREGALSSAEILSVIQQRS